MNRHSIPSFMVEKLNFFAINPQPEHIKQSLYKHNLLPQL